MNYLVAPRNYDRDYGRPTHGFGDMDEYGLPRGMSPEDKREVLDRFPLPGSSSMFAPTQTRDDIDFKKIPDEVERRMRVYGQGSVGFGDTTPSPYIRQHQLDPSTPEERERFRILEGRGPFPNTEGLDPFSPNPFGAGLLDYLDQLERNSRFKDFLYRPTDKFDIRKPVYRPGIDTFDIQPLTPPETGKRKQSYQYLEQNNEVMGPKTQMFNRFANPEDGTLNNETMARVDPTDKLLLKSLRKGEIGDPNSPRIRKAIIDLEKKIYNDGRASSMDGVLMAADPVDKAAHGPQMTREQFSNYMEMRNPGFKSRTDALRMRLINAGILRGV